MPDFCHGIVEELNAVRLLRSFIKGEDGIAVPEACKRIAVDKLFADIKLSGEIRTVRKFRVGREAFDQV
jgi:hypothetical protein